MKTNTQNGVQEINTAKIKLNGLDKKKNFNRFLRRLPTSQPTSKNDAKK